MATLTALQIANPKNGKHTFGNNLVLDVRGRKTDRLADRVKVLTAGSMRWVWLGTINGKRTEITIGKSPALTLKQADKIAAEMCNLRTEGKDPRLAPSLVAIHGIPTVSKITFRADMGAYYEREHRLWSKRHASTWLASLTNQAKSLLDKPTASITADDVLDVIRPLWTTLNATADRILGRINVVINLALTLHPDRFPLPINPCARARMMLPLGVRPAEVNREAMNWQDVPAFYSQLADENCVKAYALRFLLLNGCPRADEVRLATWAEIDGDLWTAPASHLKNRKSRTNRLTAEALAVLDAVRPETVVPTDPIFRNLTGGRMSHGALLRLLQRLSPRKEPEAKPFTVHGFRASFTGWTKLTHRSHREEAEILLDHTVTGPLGTAYDREALMAERYELCNWWSDFLTAQPQAMALAA
jgi:integrase